MRISKTDRHTLTELVVVIIIILKALGISPGFSFPWWCSYQSVPALEIRGWISRMANVLRSAFVNEPIQMAFNV